MNSFNSQKVKNLLLVGFMGAGKTTVGKVLACRLGWRFVDLDAVIVEDEGASIADIFASRGESSFRAIETRTLQKFAGQDGLVIATGGGIVIHERNWRLMNALGYVVYLHAAEESLLARLQGATGRPLADGLSREEIIARYRQRLPFYRRAGLEIDTSCLAPDEVAARILSSLEKA